MCPRSKKERKNDEIDMDGDSLPTSNNEEDTVDSKVDAALAAVHEKYNNMTAKEMLEMAERSDIIDTSEFTLLPSDIAKSLPLIGITASLLPKDVVIPVKLSFGELKLYVYEYDGKDTAMVYFTSPVGVIIGTNAISISGTSALRFECNDILDQPRVTRDLDWNPETTLKDLQDRDMFASEAHIKAEEERVNDVIAEMKAEAKKNTEEELAASAMSKDEEVF